MGSKIDKVEKTVQILEYDKLRLDEKTKVQEQKILHIENKFKLIEESLLMKEKERKVQYNSKLDSQYQTLENNILGINRKVEEMLWLKEHLVNHYDNFETIFNRISDMEGWMLATTDGINNKIIPNIAKSNRAIEGISKRIDSIYKHKNNRPTFDQQGNQLTLRTDLLNPQIPQNIDKREFNRENKENENFFPHSNGYILDKVQQRNFLNSLSRMKHVDIRNYFTLTQDHSIKVLEQTMGTISLNIIKEKIHEETTSPNRKSLEV